MVRSNLQIGKVSCRVRPLKRSDGYLSLVFLLSILCHRCVAWSASPGESSGATNVIAEYDIRPNGDFINVPVLFNTQRYPFCLGTGSTYWAFDVSFHDVLRVYRPPKSASGPVAKPKELLVTLPEAHIEGLPAPADSPGTIRAVHLALHPLGQEIYGTVGFRFLENHIFSIDFDRGKLIFLRKVDPDLGEEFRITIEDGPGGPQAPFIAIQLPGASERFLLDTAHCGFSAGTIARPTFERLVAEGRLSLLQSSQRAFILGKGNVDVRVGMFKEFSAGSFRHRGLVFDEAQASALGLGYFSRYVVTFDFPNRRMFLRPGKQYDRPEQYNRGGIAIARLEGRTLVGELERGGPGEAAGLQSMDELITVDGTKGSDLSVFELCRKFAQPGRREVVFIRNGIRKKTTVVIDDMPKFLK